MTDYTFHREPRDEQRAAFLAYRDRKYHALYFAIGG